MDFALNIESKFSPMLLRRVNTWYSVNNGNWSDPNTWMSNGLDKRGYTSPQPGDNVCIYHNVNLNLTPGATAIVNNLTITGKLSWVNGTNSVQVNGELNCTGTIDHSTGASAFLTLNGNNTILSNYISNSTSTVSYFAPYYYDQVVAPVTYSNLNLGRGVNEGGAITNTKNLQGNLNVTGNLTLGCNLNAGSYNITVTGTTINQYSSTTINCSGSLLFIGSLNANLGHTTTFNNGGSVECRGGMNTNNGAVNFGTSPVNFTTNNQSLLGAAITFNSSVTITGAITVTVASGNTAPVIIAGTLNGTVAGSTWTNNGITQLNNTNTPMSTGVWNYMAGATSVLSYQFNGNYTLPYTAYAGLIVGGTGVKSLAGNTTISYTLLVSGTGGVSTNGLDCVSYNLQVTNTTNTNGSCSIMASASGGTLTFIGLVTCGAGSGMVTNVGNPTLEFRGGITLGSAAINPGTGTINFTTNNQSINLGSGPSTWNGAVNVAAGITVTNTTTTSTVGNFVISGQLNGLSSTSTFINNGFMDYQNANAPMLTGNFYCNQATNTFRYNATGNQDIQPPNDAVSPGYKNLTLAGSGAKKLLGNVSVKGTYTLTGPATLNSNGFSLTNP